MTQQNNNPQQEEERGVGSRSRRPRPYEIEYRFRFGSNSTWSEWRRHGKYRTESERDIALENLRRKHTAFLEYRYRKAEHPK